MNDVRIAKFYLEKDSIFNTYAIIKPLAIFEDSYMHLDVIQVKVVATTEKYLLGRHWHQALHTFLKRIDIEPATVAELTKLRLNNKISGADYTQFVKALGRYGNKAK